MKISELPKVAVLLAAYNGEKYIKEQIESIKNQIGFNIHIFISIDESTDNTLKLCREYPKEFVTILPPTLVKFGSAGLNFYRLFRDVDIEQFDFIALSDQDDLWKKNKLERAIGIILKYNLDAYSSDVECFWEDSKKTAIIKKSFPQKKWDYIFEPAGPGCTYILNKSLAKNIKNEILKSKNLPFHHDWFIYAFARNNNYKWHIDNHTSILYRQHKNNQVGANYGLNQKIKRLILMKNGIYKKQCMEILKSLEINDSFIKKLRFNVIKNPFNYRRNYKEAIALFFFALLGLI